MRIKVSAAILIFCVLFSSAWYLNMQHEKNLNQPLVSNAEEPSNIIKLHYSGHTNEKIQGEQKLEVFQPREYVKIRKAF